MSKPLSITQRQITAICKGAKAAGYIAEVVIGDVTVRLVPHSSMAATPKVPEEFETLANYLAWRDGLQTEPDDDDDLRF